MGKCRGGSCSRNKNKSSCGPKKNSPKKRIGALRVVHNIPGAPNVDVYVQPKRGGKRKRVLTDVAYKQVSPYLNVPAATYIVQVTPTGQEDILIQGNVKIHNKSLNTAIAVGDVSDLENLGLLVVSDDGSCARNRKGRLRFIHGAAAIPNVDVLVDAEKVLSDVAFGDVSDYLRLDAPEMYGIEVLVSATQQVALDTSILLENRQNLTLLASGIPGSEETPVTAIPLVDNDELCS